MKIHRLLADAIAEALSEIFGNRKYADKLIERLFKANPKWGSRDRAFVAENIYEIVRWRRMLGALADAETPAGKKECLRLLGVNLILKDVPLPAWEEFMGLNQETILAKKTAIESQRAIFHSIPDWLDQLGAAELGDIWEPELAALNRPAEVILRANTLKISKQELQNQFATQGLETTETSLSPDALVLKKRINVFQHPLFKEGYYEIQDAGSQCIAPFLQVEPGMRVIDACAGAGGKTMHLACLMENKGRLIALDVIEWKLGELRIRARRNGIGIIQTKVIDSTKVIKRLHGTADRLLLDSPCSGLGVLRRNPDAKWNLTPEFIENVKLTQAKILNDYTAMLRPGGKAVYATCSILPSENEQQVKSFLTRNTEFKWLDERKITPATDGFDGFYMALLEKTK
jgi:16S rRNA (cytosine967-C5)-methyltransferase